MYIHSISSKAKKINEWFLRPNFWNFDEAGRNFLFWFFFKYHCRQSIMLLSCCVFTAKCIDQTNTKCFPFQKKVFYIIWETNRTICPYITLQLIILSTVCTQVHETSWTEYGIFSDISHVNLSLMKHLSRHLLFTYSGLGFLQWRPTIYMLLK